MTPGFYCQTCGAFHEELPMDYGAQAPHLYYDLPEAERATRCELTDELCVIDDEFFFLRGCLEIPILDADRPLVWGVWVSLSRDNFARTAELWETPGREAEPPMFGWLMTSLPLYPNTLSLKTHVHTRPIGERPTIELEPTDHPLAVEQREGISLARVEEIAAAILHGGG
ncbi:DUF2199 domain-containing protein [Blastopirellula marina]|uniref:DUF2199 domain-containing protein n=1 Tax=Blastopirellula marina TaxID=124 RepID=A0A2S8GFJ5_9BACT|nr:DUF2199 domain-containing protein [Blastopirellula marina]PQO43237.1 DUF2199 domain-containing protein [Blastopirellula marina]